MESYQRTFFFKSEDEAERAYVVVPEKVAPKATKKK